MLIYILFYFGLLFFFSSSRRHTMWPRDWSSDVCSSDLLVLFLYLCVMGVFFWLQQLQSDSVMFITIDQETRQQRLFWVVIALSLLIVLSLLALWNYTRFRTRAEAALIAETSFRRAMENSMSTGMRVFDMDGRIAYVNPAFCRMIGWNEADLIGRTAPFPYWISGRHEHHQETLDI